MRRTNVGRKSFLTNLRTGYLTKRQLGFVLLLPSSLIIFCVLIYPLFYSIYISFHDMNINRPARGVEFVGVEHYRDTIKNREFWDSLGRTAYFVLFDICIGMPLGLGIALLLHKRFHFRGVVRALVILPYVLPPTVNGLIWKWMYNPDYGFLNGVLFNLGIISEYKAWLSSPLLALHMLILANLWQGTPFAIMLYLAGLQTIPKELMDAAKVDGATGWQTLTKVILPLLVPISLVMAVLKTIATFKIFDLVYVLTGGGPANSTQVISYYIYRESFDFLKIGYGAAISYTLTLVILVLVYVYFKLLKTEDIY